MENSNKQARRDQIQSRISFLEEQLEGLNHYLPQTYELLMYQLDCQKCELAQLDIQTAYAVIASENPKKESNQETVSKQKES